MDPLKPSPNLLAKLGSVIVHVEEAAAPGGHPFDVTAIRSILADPEVAEWMKGMGKLALLPVKRAAGKR